MQHFKTPLDVGGRPSGESPWRRYRTYYREGLLKYEVSLPPRSSPFLFTEQTLKRPSASRRGLTDYNRMCLCLSEWFNSTAPEGYKVRKYGPKRREAFSHRTPGASLRALRGRYLIRRKDLSDYDVRNFGKMFELQASNYR
jgi:hypothetical protein